MGTLLGLFEVEAGAAQHDFVAEIHEGAEHILEVHRHRAAAYQSYVIDSEARLEGGVFEEGVENDIGVGTLLYADDHTDSLAGSFVVDIGDALYALVLDHLADALYHVLLVDHIGNLRHDDGLAAVVGDFDFGLGTDDDAAAAGFIGILDALNALDDAAGREIGTLDMLHQTFSIDFGVVDVGADGVADLAEVVRGHVGCHTYSDTGRAVQQQERSLGGKHRRLFDGVVEVQLEIDGILVEVGEDFLRELFKLGLGVTHGGNGVAVHRTEVTLTENERIALVPVLGEAGHGVVDAGIAVRVEFTEHFTHDSGAFLGLAGITQAKAVHAEQNPSLHRLQAIAGIRECARNDDGHGVIDVRAAHFLVDIDLLDNTGFLLFL